MGANAEYVRRWADAFNRRDVDALMADAGPDFEWVPARENPGATVKRGAEGAAAYLEDWVAVLPDIKVEAEETVEDGDRVLTVLKMTGTGAGSGATTEVRMATISTFRDGVPVRTEEFLDLDEARAVFDA